MLKMRDRGTSVHKKLLGAGASPGFEIGGGSRAKRGFLPPRSRNMDAQNARKGYIYARERGYVPLSRIFEHRFFELGVIKNFDPDHYIGHWGTPHIKSKKIGELSL